MEVKRCKDDATDIGEVIDDETYTLLLPNFLMGGGDGYEMLRNINIDETAEKNQNEIFIEYIKSLPDPIRDSDISNFDRIKISGKPGDSTSEDSSSEEHKVCKIPKKVQNWFPQRPKPRFLGKNSMTKKN